MSKAVGIMFERLKAIIAEYLPKDAQEITLETDFRGDLGLTSLELVDMSVAIEEEFGVTISELEIVTGKTVGDVLILIKNSKTKK